MKKSLLVFMSISVLTIGYSTNVGAQEERLAIKMVNFYARKALQEGKSPDAIVQQYQFNILTHTSKAIGEEMERIKQSG